MRLLLLSAYDAHSHRQWHQSLREGLADWDWKLLTLPPRHFSWRVRGNPLYWAATERETLEAKYDLLLATSMVDLAALRGLVPSLAALPTALYFHENQFAYPEGQGRHGVLEAQMVSLYSALAADRLLFNSAWNRDSFLEGLEQLLDRLPDAVPTGIPDVLAQKSDVLPVPVAVGVPVASRDDGPLQVLWNHRWEYDKDPGLLLDIARQTRGLDLVFNVVGQQFRSCPDEFDSLKRELSGAESLGEWGFVEDRQAYWDLLGRCDVALSTAAHDFQGLASLLGCTPLVPDRLAYPEWFGEEFRFGDAAEAARRLAELAASKSAGEELPAADLSGLTAAALLPRYRQVLESLAA